MTVTIKKFISIIAALGMILSVLPVSADDEEDTSADANETGYAAVVTYSDGTEYYADLVDAWNTAAGAESSEDSPITVKLLADCGIDSCLSSYEAYIILDLNGYTIDRGLTEAEEPVICTWGGKLTINDSSSEQTGKITGGYDVTCGGVCVLFGDLEINGGQICGNTADVSTAGDESGSGISTADEDLYAVDDDDTDSSTEDEEDESSAVAAVNAPCGGVVIEYGNFTMNGGSICDNTGAYAGGLWASGGTVTINGGEICDNTSEIYAGGIFLNGCEDAKITGGVISGNTALYGGGIYADSSTLTISGGEISGNTAQNGGGIYADGSTVAVSGGTVKENYAVNNTTYTGDPYGGGICVDNSAISVSGNPVITDNTLGSVYLESGETITIADTLTEGADIGVCAAGAPTDYSTIRAITGAADADYSSFFTSENDGCIIKTDEDNSLCLVQAPAASRQDSAGLGFSIDEENLGTESIVIYNTGGSEADIAASDFSEEDVITVIYKSAEAPTGIKAKLNDGTEYTISESAKSFGYNSESYIGIIQICGELNKSEPITLIFNGAEIELEKPEN